MQAEAWVSGVAVLNGLWTIELSTSAADMPGGVFIFQKGRVHFRIVEDFYSHIIGQDSGAQYGIDRETECKARAEDISELHEASRYPRGKRGGGNKVYLLGNH
jgi:hypothetical protein